MEFRKSEVSAQILNSSIGYLEGLWVRVSAQRRVMTTNVKMIHAAAMLGT